MKIVIAGYGVEGRSNLAYFQRKFPAAEFVITDERAVTDAPKGVVVESGKDVFTRLGDADLVVRTASLPPRSIATDGKIWSATNEFFAKCPAPIIGVTGTKGKGTTCSLIASILRAAGKTVHLVGNIGVPALDVLPKISPDDFVVYELSSFQLWDLEKSPQVAVILMIEPDHLDVHESFEEYLDAKKNIRRHQSLRDTCLYHPMNKFSQQVAATSFDGLLAKDGEPTCDLCGGDALDFAARYGVQEDNQVYVKDGYFCVQDRQICSIDHLKLPGGHNLGNACAAMSAVTGLGLNITDEQYAEGLAAFTGLPHRLKFVSEKNGVKFYDDSISTTPGSAIAAMKAFAAPKVMILGGSHKGADFTDLATEITKNNLRSVILIGSEADRIEQALTEVRDCKIINLGITQMDHIVQTSIQQAEPGDVVILSPACASFGMFKNYQDRGDQFIAAVKSLSEGKQ